MAEPEEEIRELATAIIEECGEDAHHWATLRAAHLRGQGDRERAVIWDRVANMVLRIQNGRRYH
jgi:hypothetical protein